MAVEVHNAPRGAKKILFNGEWREVVLLESDSHPVTTRKENNPAIHGNAVRSARRVLRLEPKRQKEAITKDLTKKKQALLKEQKGIERITPKIREIHSEFLLITDRDIHDELGRLAAIAYSN